jgi:Ca-activated chloride channel homolog
MTCPQQGDASRDYVREARGIPLKFHNGTGFMREYAHTNKYRSNRNCAFRNPCLAAFFFLIILPGTFSQTEYAPDDPFTINICVETVVLNATVSDRKGAPVSGLAIKDFQVYEDEKPQQIECFSHEDIPVTAGLVIDDSGTMGPKRSEVIASALAFARSSNPEDQMFVVKFNENVSFGLPDNMPFTGKVAQLEIALSGIATDGMTALYDAVAAALNHLKKGDRDKKVLIVISDGGDNASKLKLDSVLDMARKSDAIIYTIGIFDEDDPDRNPRALKELAKATGGEAFLPDSAKEVVPICKQIAHDIRSQYSITYHPTNDKQDGSFRAIKVTAGAQDGKRLIVRTRAGYYAPLKSQPLPKNEQSHEDPP